MSDIVIDADIMRSAGTSEHPHSSAAREVLEAIRDHSHRMVQCAPLKVEHDKHQSRFASAWRASMLSRKQWVHWKYEENENVREILEDAMPPESPGKVTAVLKDTHLLEAAAATEHRIISKDKTARDLFRLACPLPGSFRRILWGEMSLSAGEVIDWVRAGCDERDDFRLCPGPAAGSEKVRKRTKK